jgi:hypothetical protein
MSEIKTNQKSGEAFPETRFQWVDKDGDHFLFTCEGCRAHGTLTVPPGTKRFKCPEDCGAIYVPWVDGNKPKLMCVVKPVLFETVACSLGGPDSDE